MRAPRIDQINVVVGEVEAAAQFLIGLGVQLPAAPQGWDAHHRTIPTAPSLHVGHELAEPAFGIDLDSSTFAQQWGGLAPSFSGVVVNVRVDERPDVDRLYERALSIGGRSLKDALRRVLGLEVRRGRRTRLHRRRRHERAGRRAPQRSTRSELIRLTQRTLLVQRPERVRTGVDNSARIGDTTLQHLFVSFHDESLSRPNDADGMPSKCRCGRRGRGVPKRSFQADARRPLGRSPHGGAIMRGPKGAGMTHLDAKAELHAPAR